VKKSMRRWPRHEGSGTSGEHWFNEGQKKLAGEEGRKPGLLGFFGVRDPGSENIGKEKGQKPTNKGLSARVVNARGVGGGGIKMLSYFNGIYFSNGNSHGKHWEGSDRVRRPQPKKEGVLRRKGKS